MQPLIWRTREFCQLSERYAFLNFMGTYENSHVIQPKVFPLCNIWAVLGPRATEGAHWKRRVRYDCRCNSQKKREREDCTHNTRALDLESRGWRYVGWETVNKKATTIALLEEVVEVLWVMDDSDSNAMVYKRLSLAGNVLLMQGLFLHWYQ